MEGTISFGVPLQKRAMVLKTCGFFFAQMAALAASWAAVAAVRGRRVQRRGRRVVGFILEMVGWFFRGWFFPL